jgi:hypothetical protein
MLKVWDVAQGIEVRTLSGHHDQVSAVAWSPNEPQVVSGSWDRTLKVWDVTQGTEVHTLSGHRSGVFAVAWSPDGRQVVFEALLTGLHTELRALGITNLPHLPAQIDAEAFRQGMLACFIQWQQTGRREPFLFILDEIDKFFPSREVRDSEAILAEYVRCFRMLRGLAQSHRCLVLLVIAYRPDINRQNLLVPSVGENPMFQSFQEEHLGFLSAEDSTTMIREIGLWKNIIWDANAAQRVFDYCGGHPLITRFFASIACDEGDLKQVDYPRVEETAAEIQATFRRNQIGDYYKEGILELLSEDERDALFLVGKEEAAGLSEADIPQALENALTHLEHFGLVTSRDGTVRLSGQLFSAWLQRRVAS